MESMGMLQLGTWEMRKHAVVQHLSLLHSHANTYESMVISFDDELVATVKRKMNGELDLQCLLDMCMCTSDIEIGTYNDPSSKCLYRMGCV
jgi:hypothetical protein